MISQQYMVLYHFRRKKKFSFKKFASPIFQTSTSEENDYALYVSDHHSSCVALCNRPQHFLHNARHRGLGVVTLAGFGHGGNLSENLEFENFQVQVAVMD